MSDNLLATIFGIAAILATLVYLRTFINIAVSLTACILRWKEAVNLEESMTLARDRNLVYSIILIPSTIIASRYNILNLDFCQNLGSNLNLLCYTVIFVIWALIRWFISHSLNHRQCSERLWAAYIHSFRNFAICCCYICLVTVGICDKLDCGDELIRELLWGATGLSYLVYLSHKGHIFSSANSAFTSFLYLCALEIAPCTLLIAISFLF